MRRNGSIGLALGALLASALWLTSGCNQPGTGGQSSASMQRSVPAGTRVEVALRTTISSETAHVGDPWHGTVTSTVTAADGSGIPAGSPVDGQVAAVTAARRGSRAMVQLDVTRIVIDGDGRPVHASANAVIAGSTRKRNVGAVAGGALAGALIGKMVGDGRNATAGAVIGGAAATGVVAESKGFQVVLASGTVMRFTVSQAIAMR